jgi:hypothetical protein
MTFKAASTDVAWWHRIGESGKPTRSWAACFSDPAKQTNFWDMAMALANELANLGGEVGLEQDWRQEGQLQGEARRGQGLHDSKGGHIQHNGCRSRRGELNPGSGCGHDRTAADQAALLQTLTAALSKSVAGDKGGKR